MANLFLTFLMAVLLAGNASQHAEAQQSTAESSEGLFAIGPKTPYLINFTFSSPGGPMVFPCSTPQVKAKCSLDTGIWESHFRTLGPFDFKPATFNCSAKALDLPNASTQIVAKAGRLEELRFGGNIGIGLPALEFLVFGGFREIAGYLGLHFFSQTKMAIDFQNNVFYLPKDKPEPKNAKSFAKPSQRLVYPWINVCFGEQTAIGDCEKRDDLKSAVAWLDTGSDGSLVDSKVVDKHPENFTCDSELGAASFQGGQPVFLRVCQIHYLVFGKLSLRNVEVYVTDLTRMFPQDGEAHFILGLNMMRSANWWFDFPNGRWAAFPFR